MSTHVYRSALQWAGSTAAGYQDYSRSHTVTPYGTAPFTMSADHAFRGDPGLANPEVLLLAAASSCQLLSFLALAAKARIDVIAYFDEADAVMPEDDPPTRITRITLRPRITVRGSAATKVERLVRLAHQECYIANSLSAAIVIEPEVTIT